jgi:hypothetical protein
MTLHVVYRPEAKRASERNSADTQQPKTYARMLMPRSFDAAMSMDGQSRTHDGANIQGGVTGNE